MTDLDIGPGQMKVLRLLWERKRMTAQEAAEILREAEGMKFNTVATFLRALVRKKVAAYDVDGRTFIYYPLVNPDEIRRHEVRKLIDHVFAGSADNFVSYIMKSGEIDSRELEQIRELLDRNEEDRS